MKSVNLLLEIWRLLITGMNGECLKNLENGGVDKVQEVLAKQAEKQVENRYKSDETVCNRKRKLDSDRNSSYSCLSATGNKKPRLEGTVELLLDLTLGQVDIDHEKELGMDRLKQQSLEDNKITSNNTEESIGSVHEDLFYFDEFELAMALEVGLNFGDNCDGFLMGENTRKRLDLNIGREEIVQNKTEVHP